MTVLEAEIAPISIPCKNNNITHDIKQDILVHKLLTGIDTLKKIRDGVIIYETF